MRWHIALVILLFGVITNDRESLKWSMLGILLFSLPLLLQFAKSEILRVWALWGGFFLIFQALWSPLLINGDFKTLPPNMHEIIDIGVGIPGITGKQLVTTDAKGFRTTKDIDYESNTSYRIFVIGGSTTEQILLDDRNTWTHLLQEYLSERIQPNVEVINTGVSGVRAKHHLATFRNIAGLHPDLVVFLVGINDWNWHIKEAFSQNYHNTGIAAFRAKLLLKDTMLGNFILLVNSSLRKDYGEYFTKQRGSLSRATVVSFHPEGIHQKYAKHLLEISKACHENGIKCLFITQPTGYEDGASEEFKKGFWMTPPRKSYTLDFESMVYISSLYNSFLVGFSVDNDHYSCDAAAVLAPSFENFFDECHFNTKGAKKMSVIVGQCVENVIGSNDARNL